MTENEIAKEVVDAAYKIHSRLGPGLLESVYRALLTYELERRGLRVQSEVDVPLVYDELRLEIGFRADLIVEGKVIVELKSVEKMHPVYKKQLLTYLRVTGLHLGLLINFGETLVKDGIVRMLNGVLEPTTAPQS